MNHSQSVFFAFVAVPGKEGMKKTKQEREGRKTDFSLQSGDRRSVSRNAFVPDLIMEGNLSGTL